MKKNKSTIILILVFFVGLSVMLYPTLSDYVNQLHQSRAVATYAEDVDNLTDADYSAYFEAADAFNAQIAADPENTALYIERGKLHYRCGEWGPALNDFNRVLARDASHVEARQFAQMVQEILEFRYKDIYNP